MRKTFRWQTYIYAKLDNVAKKAAKNLREEIFVHSNHVFRSSLVRLPRRQIRMIDIRIEIERMAECSFLPKHFACIHLFSKSAS